MTSDAMIVGRYAPSPTGDLHLGNIRTALLAWLQVRLQGGKFLMRMEDLDAPRVVKGSADQILRDLEWLGLDWDGEVVYQSQRKDLYEQALKNLEQQNLVYPCYCSRKDIQQAASAPHSNGVVYSGVCRDLTDEQRNERSKIKQPAVRCKVNAQLMSECGDFVVKRADGLFAYQLAVVVDDLEQGVNTVLRGQDLFESTERQKYLAHKLAPNLPEIEYVHVPLMLDESGSRMSKRDGSQSVSEYRDKGYSAEKILGELIYSLGWRDIKDAVSTKELLRLFSNKVFSFGESHA